MSPAVAVAPAEPLAGLDVVELPDLDEVVPCLLTFNGKLCGLSSTWRCLMTCSRCGARLFELMSGLCRARLLDMGFPSAPSCEITTNCCKALVRDVEWVSL